MQWGLRKSLPGAFQAFSTDIAGGAIWPVQQGIGGAWDFNHSMDRVITASVVKGNSKVRCNRQIKQAPGLFHIAF